MNSKDDDPRYCDTSFDFDELFENLKFDEKVEDKKSFNSSIFSYLKDALIGFIEKNSKHHLIIGLTGKWGSGKTSFCKYLEYILNKESNSNERESLEKSDSEIKDNLSSSEESNKKINSNSSKSTQSKNKREYVFFFYDLWTHQHETLRKSILSELSSYLLEKKILNNKRAIHPNKNLFKWMEKTNVGSIYNHEKSSFYPILSFALVVSGIWWVYKNISFFTCFLNEIGRCILQLFNNINCCEKYSNLPSQEFVPCGLFLLLLVFVVIGYAVFSRFKSTIGTFFSRVYSFLFSKRSFKSILSTNNNDLSFADMRFWMESLIANIKENYTVIVVLDNLDRLDGRIVKDLFSTVHELFSELNISCDLNKKFFNSNAAPKKQEKNLHLIIPFDYRYLLEIYPSSIQKQQNFSNVIANLDASFSSSYHEQIYSEGKDELARDNKSAEQRNTSNDELDSILQDEASKSISSFNIQSTLLNDYLDKMFSTIFYLPHVNPFNFYDIFEDKLKKILVKWCGILREFNQKHVLFFEYIEKKDRIPSRKALTSYEFCKAIEDFEHNDLNKLIKFCWQILRLNIEKKDFGSSINSNTDNNSLFSSKASDAPLYKEVSIRRIISFLRDFAVILQVNSRNLFINKTLGLKKIPLYVALYCRYITFFRSLGFANVLNIIGDQWRIKRLGIYEDISKRSCFTKSEADDYQYFVLYTNLEIIYYQTSFDNLTDELYTETLFDAFRLNRYVILLYKLNTSYFAQNTRDILTFLLENNPNYYNKIINLFNKLLSDDLLFGHDERNLKIWRDIYCQFLVFFSEDLLFANKTRSDLFNDRHFYKQLYDFLDRLLNIKIKNNFQYYKKNLDLMISYLRILVYQFSYFNDSDSIKFFISCVRNYIEMNKAYETLFSDESNSNNVEDTSNIFKDDFIELPPYLKNDVDFGSYAEKKQCLLFVCVDNVVLLSHRLKDNPELLEDINQLSLVFFIKDQNRNTSELNFLKGYPISKEMRLFYVNHFAFSFDNHQYLIKLFCELLKLFIDYNKLDSEFLHRIQESELSLEEKRDDCIKLRKSILRYLYIYVLLASKTISDCNKYICSDFFDDLEDDFISILHKLDLTSCYDKVESTNHLSVKISDLPPFVRLVLLIIVKFKIDVRHYLPSQLEKIQPLEKNQGVSSSDLENSFSFDKKQLDSVGDVSSKGVPNQDSSSTTGNMESLFTSQNDSSKKNDIQKNLNATEEQELERIIYVISLILHGDDSINVSLDLNDLYSSIKDMDNLFFLKWLTSWKWNFKDLKNECIKSK